MYIPEQVLNGDSFGLTLLMKRDIAADELNQVVKQQAEGELKNRRFRRAPDQSLQAEDFGDLLEDLFNAPALQVVIEQFLGRIELAINEVRDQRHVRLAGPLQRDLPDKSAFRMVGRPQPAPLFEIGSPSGVDRRPRRPPLIPVEADLGVTADVGEFRRLLAEKTGQALQHEQDRDAEQSGQLAACKEATRLDGERLAAADRLKLLDERVRTIQQEISRASGRHDGLVDQLASCWREQATNLDRPAVDRLDTERLALDRSGVIRRCRALEQDAARRGEWVKQLAEVNDEPA